MTLRKKNLFNYKVESINFLASNFELLSVFTQIRTALCFACRLKFILKQFGHFLLISVIIFQNDLPSKRHLVSFSIHVGNKIIVGQMQNMRKICVELPTETT